MPHRQPGTLRWILALAILTPAFASLRVARSQTPVTPPALSWLWVSPLPHGNNIYDLGSDGAVSVQAGDRGRIYTSFDGEFWRPHASGTTNALRAVTFTPQRIVIVGEEGAAAWVDRTDLANSLQPIDFTPATLGTSDWLEGVASSDSLVVAVGDNGAVHTSPDGASWTRRPQPFATWLRGVAHGNGTWVAVGEDGFAASSSDGIQWQMRNSGTAEDLNRVAWIDDRFVAVGDNGRIQHSTRGITWSALDSGTTNDLYALAGNITLAGTRWTLLVGGDLTLRLFEHGLWSDETSSARSQPAPVWSYYGAAWDGIFFTVGGATGMFVEGLKESAISPFSWFNRTQGVRHWIWDLAQIGDVLVAVGDRGTLETSTDAVHWELELVPSAATNQVLLGATGNPDRWVVVGTQGTILTSPNGVAWSLVTPPPVTNDLQGVTLRGEEFFACGGAGAIVSSPDGLEWRLRARPTTALLSGLVSGPNGLVGVGESGTLLTSPDGDQWDLHPLNTTAWLYRVRYLRDRYVVVGANGTLATSPDARIWTFQSTGTTAWLNDVTWFNGWFYVFGGQGTVLASPDTVAWQRVPIITQKSLYAALATPAQLVVAGIEGLILRGQSAPIAFLGYQRNHSTNTFLLSGVPAWPFTVEGTAAFADWTPHAAGRFIDPTGLAYVAAEATNPPPRELYRSRLTP